MTELVQRASLVATPSPTALSPTPARAPAPTPAPTLVPAPAPTLRGRAAAYAVTKECLRLQSAAQPRSRLARVFGRDPLHPDAVSWYRGALGELEVARILARLGGGWTVLHAVPVGSRGADIDHVVIGPGGTFTINTKNHGGKKIWAAGSVFMVNGQKLAHIKHSLYEAERASRLLSEVAGTPVAVTPLIVVVNPESLTRKKPDVVVMSSGDLHMWLRRRPQMQTDAAVARIVWAAERGDTWVDDRLTGDVKVPDVSGQAETQNDALKQERAFSDLRVAVDAARSRRQAWSLLGAAAFLAAVIGAAMAIAPFIPAIVAALMGAA